MCPDGSITSKLKWIQLLVGPHTLVVGPHEPYLFIYADPFENPPAHNLVQTVALVPVQSSVQTLLHTLLQTLAQFLVQTPVETPVCIPLY
jgi:hypothetical protein